ncbi:hypothetical protein Gotur_010079 [Gossypium turneri]
MLKAKPNLESIIRTLKSDWAIVYDMLSGKNNSGFGWDEHRQLVVAEDVSHKEVDQFKHCNFPYYDQLIAIYAKDRAIGKDAQIAVDIIEEIDVEDVATTNTHKERNDFSWIFQLHNRNHLETKVIPHLLHLLMLPLYWRKT